MTADPRVAERPGWASYLAFALASFWVILITLLAESGAWAADQLLLIQEMAVPAITWPAISWVHALLLAIVIVPLAMFTRSPRFAATYRTWAVAIAFLLVLSPVRFVPKTETQLAAAAQILLGLLCAAALLNLVRRRGLPLVVAGSAMIPALAAVPVIVAPWLAFGALGSPLDAVLNLLAGASLGLFAGLLLATFLIVPLALQGQRSGIGFAGFAAALALLVLGAGFGFGGSQLLLMGVLPPLGVAAVAVARFAPTARGSWPPMAALVGGAAAAPLMFVDPVELTVLLSGQDVPFWAGRAAVLSFLLALLVGIVLWRLRPARAPRAEPSLALLGLTWLAALLVYFVVGQPGFYGEWLFVILRDQADVSQANTIADRGERASYVYRTLTQHAASSQADLRATLDRFGIAYRPYYLVNGLEVNGGPLLRLYLSRRPEVDRVLNSTHLRPLPAPIPVSTGSDKAPAGPPWNITSIGAERVWQELGVTGEGIVVGQSDSGVQGTHPALRDGYRGRDGQNDYNWLDPWNGTSAPVDIGGHGTHTLGSVLGRGDIGVAPGAEWFACVNLARDIGNPAFYLDCMQFMLAPYPQHGDPFNDGDPHRAAHVTNNSWGCPPLEGCDAGSLRPAVNAMRAAGIFVVASAGNSGPRCASVSDPIAIYEDAFTVGAMDKDGNVAAFSSRGPVTVDGSDRPKPEALAPGVDVLSSFPGSTYQVESGTSMAGPHVAGVVALMWSAQPRLVGDVERTEQILIQSARPYTGTREGCFAGNTPNDAYGYGLIDAYAAVQAALQGR